MQAPNQRRPHHGLVVVGRPGLRVGPQGLGEVPDFTDDRIWVDRLKNRPLRAARVEQMSSSAAPAATRFRIFSSVVIAALGSLGNHFALMGGRLLRPIAPRPPPVAGLCVSLTLIYTAFQRLHTIRGAFEQA